MKESKFEYDTSALDEQALPSDPKELRSFIEELKEPVDQVVFRHFVALRSKSGADVTEAIQKLVLGINKEYPVKTIHCDPGTEFSSYALSKWMAQHNIAVQHSLPTDKRGNGLAERTVGWVKSRVRTLLRAADLPVQWWPLAARWATATHNRSIKGLPPLPAFGQPVLHKVKQPADGVRQLMGRWVQHRYGAPHLTIPEGHTLITDQGNLVGVRPSAIGCRFTHLAV